MKAIKSTIAQSGTALYIKAIIFGTLAGSMSLAVLLALGCVGLLITSSIPHDYLSIIAIALCAVSSFISGYISARITKEKGFFIGIISGIIMFVIVLLSGLIWGDGSFTFLTPLKLVLLMLFGALGGIKAVNKKDRIHIK